MKTFAALRSIVGRSLRRVTPWRNSAWEPRPRPPRRRGRSIGVPFACPVPPSDGLPHRAVVAHMFHADMGEEFLGCFHNIPGAVDLYISTDTDEKAAALRRTFGGWSQGTLTIRVVPNVGRDIAPKFVTFADVYPRYDAVLCVHSKKSVYLDAGFDWRTMLLQTLCGSPETVNAVLRLLGDNTGVGLAFPDHYAGIADRLSWGGNREMAGALAERAGIPLDRARMLEFVSGSMFWVRPSALAPLLSLGLAYEDFPPEAGQLDATVAHALERLLLYSTEAAGLSWLRLADARFAAGVSRIVEVKSLDALPEAIRRCRTPLLP